MLRLASFPDIAHRDSASGLRERPTIRAACNRKDSAAPLEKDFARRDRLCSQRPSGEAVRSRSQDQPEARWKLAADQPPASQPGSAWSPWRTARIELALCNETEDSRSAPPSRFRRAEPAASALDRPEFSP